MKSLETAIRNGVDKGYFENLFLKVPDSDMFEPITEYLLTVNVAQSLLKWQSRKSKSHYSIIIEPNVDYFLTNAFQKYSHTTKTGRGNHSIDPNGRLDIGILVRAKMGWRSCFGIEIKEFNPSWELIRNDISRLLTIIEETDHESLPNNISHCYLVFIKRYGSKKTHFEDAHYDRSLIKLPAALEKNVISKLRASDTVNVSYETWRIHKTTSTQYAESLDPDWVEDAEVAENSGAVFGVLFKLKRI